MLLLQLGACGLLGREAKVVLYDPKNKQESTSSSSGKYTPAPVRVSASGTHIVQKGQSLYSISRAYGTPLRTVIAANGLNPPYKLAIGQKLRIPKARTYKVRRGDTVYGISRQFDVAMNELVRVNGLIKPYTINVGQVLTLPGELGEARSKKIISKAPAAKPKAANKTNTSSKKAAPPKQPLKTTFTKKGYPKPAVRPAQPYRRVAKRPTPISQPPKRTSSKFLWPVRGRVISSFGPKGKGLQNDGLNIAAPRGTPVKASENGVVAYSGSELHAYGNLILIKHSDGYMTAYAHTGDILVKRGDRVRRGQTIARVGSSGNVDRPQLHFQVRRGKKILNPRPYLEG
ncbi:LysM peptidoglycan-binding domain-containing M23 family metallopeptidase [Aestuariispira insulae]|nr:LysM peptidoglycan-binding domain-containing M23 family metallopeptidase [Aestuariispira insulae]